MLRKLSNLVVGGVIWLNNQRPEWNDGNNALVGSGVSFVTLCYLRRYTQFFQSCLAACPQQVDLTQALGDWLESSALILKEITAELQDKPITAEQRFNYLKALGEAGSDYRACVYPSGALEKKTFQRSTIESLVCSALTLFDQTIAENQRGDGLYHTYNLLKTENQQASLSDLHPMLEGQVAILSAKALTPQ